MLNSISADSLWMECVPLSNIYFSEILSHSPSRLYNRKQIYKMCLFRLQWEPPYNAIQSPKGLFFSLLSLSYERKRPLFVPEKRFVHVIFSRKIWPLKFPQTLDFPFNANCKLGRCDCALRAVTRRETSKRCRNKERN